MTALPSRAGSSACASYPPRLRLHLTAVAEVGVASAVGRHAETARAACAAAVADGVAGADCDVACGRVDDADGWRTIEDGPVVTAAGTFEIAGRILRTVAVQPACLCRLLPCTSVPKYAVEISTETHSDYRHHA